MKYQEHLVSGESGIISSRGSALPPRTWRPSMSLCSPCRGTSSAQRERSRGWRTTRCWSCCTRRPSTTCSHPATPARSQTTSCWVESRFVTQGPIELNWRCAHCAGEAGDWTLRHGSSYPSILSTESCELTFNRLTMGTIVSDFISNDHFYQRIQLNSYLHVYRVIQKEC